ncbi:hypothetical protein [Agromyces sp. ZXT2-6]|uniref:hypothetical protein n=1 Tax=Agromyces sp. ZXT2-6 TaxID=3461153 RepID=UPI004054F24F
MSSTTPGSDPERRDLDGDGSPDAPTDRDDAAADTSGAGDAPTTGPAADVEPRPEDAQSAVDPTAGDADRVDRLEPAETPSSDAAGAPVQDTAFTGTTADADRDDAAVADRTELDAAVERARTDHPPVVVSSDPADRTDTTAMQREDLQAASPEPVRAQEARRETGVPETVGAAGAGAGTAAASASPGTAPTAPSPPSPQAIYVQAPAEPKARGNRGFGVLVGLIATVAFGLLYAGASFLVIAAFNGGFANAGPVFTDQFIVSAVFWGPVIAFFASFAVLALLLNRAAWWAWAVFGLVVGVLVYLAYIGGSLVAVAAWQFTPTEAGDFLANQWLTPYAIIAAIIARELPIWFGGWIAAHGRTVTERNRTAREEYERQLAAGPQPVSSTR